MTVQIDPTSLAVIKGRLEQIADEMDATLFRSAFNPLLPKREMQVMACIIPLQVKP
ncbi:MAG: hypothetical protein CM1200mP41_12210 [Gammaproteobacteria bacterium]|nr:MAG: hypothetical protein CM1200mP41_12210 [Gammaproteobacteria bacterium]